MYSTENQYYRFVKNGSTACLASLRLYCIGRTMAARYKNPAAQAAQHIFTWKHNTPMVTIEKNNGRYEERDPSGCEIIWRSTNVAQSLRKKSLKKKSYHWNDHWMFPQRERRP
jgi:hypothetical protein